MKFCLYSLSKNYLSITFSILVLKMLSSSQGLTYMANTKALGSVMLGAPQIKPDLPVSKQTPSIVECLHTDTKFKDRHIEVLEKVVSYFLFYYQTEMGVITGKEQGVYGSAKRGFICQLSRMVTKVDFHSCIIRCLGLFIGNSSQYFSSTFCFSIYYRAWMPGIYYSIPFQQGSGWVPQ